MSVCLDKVEQAYCPEMLTEDCEIDSKSQAYFKEELNSISVEKGEWKNLFK